MSTRALKVFKLNVMGLLMRKITSRKANGIEMSTDNSL